jgi:PAS domain S-box-containing protein
MHGFTRKEDIIGLHFSAVHIPEDVAEAQEIVETLMRGEARRGELSTLRQDGTIGYQTFSANPVLDGDRVAGLEGFLVDITAWKTAEEEKRRTLQRANEAVAKAEAHYRLMFNSVSDAVFIHEFGEDGLPSRYLEVNDSACRYLGYTREELLRMGPVDLDAPEEHPDVAVRAQTILANGHLMWEGTHVAKDGRRIPVEVNTHLVYLDGSPKILSSVRDISERKKSEESMRSLATAIEQATDTIVITDLNGIIQYCNPAFEKITGYSKEEAIGQTPRVLKSGKHSKDFYEQMWATITQGHVWTGHLTNKKKDGSSYEEDATLPPIRAASGKLSGFVAVKRDVTERIRAETALRESREQLRLFVEHTPAPIAMFDQQMRYLAHNRRWITDYGLADNDLIGRSHYDVFPEIPERWKEIHKRCLSGAVERYDEDPFPRLDGKLDWIRWEIHPWRNGEGEIGGIIIFSENVTERKCIADQLRQAQKLESIGRLAGGVAHDFNNLLTVINGYSEFLLRGLKAGDPLRPHADEIKIAGERAASLTKQLLAFSRKQVIDPKVVDLNAIIRESAAMLQRLIGDDIALDTHLDNSLGQVLADPDQMHQVIVNLAVNARDAMPNGGRLEIRTKNIELGAEPRTARHPGWLPGRYVVISVTDSGHGMDETTRQHAFEPFFTTKEVGKGTGLGLATVHGIIRQSGGWVEVSSEVGVGTCFEVYLPRLDGCASPEESRLGVVTEGNEAILLVEDQKSVRSFTGAALKDYGYHVIEAVDGDEAISAAEQVAGELHLLLTDVVMPGMNGKELSERLKKRHPNLKVLFMSGYTADVIAQRGVLDRSVAFLHKPFGPEELAQKVREVLDASPLPSVEL